MPWLATNNPPVPNSPLKYWAVVGDILRSANFQRVPVSSRPVGPLMWQPPITRRGGAIMNRGGVIPSAFPN